MLATMTPGVLFRSVVTGENPSNHVFVDGDVESQGHLLSNSRTAPGGIALLHLDNGFQEFFVGSFGAGPTPALGGEEQAILSVPQSLVEAQGVEGLRTMAERIRRAGRMRRAHKPATRRSEVRRFGDRCRERLRIKSCCLTRTDSATTERMPPGPKSRARVAMTWTKRMTSSRTPAS